MANTTGTDYTARYAVRPNLNRKGILTVHKLNGRGNPDYGHAYKHTESPVYIENCTFHINRNLEAKIQAGASKAPGMSVIGTPYFWSEDLQGDLDDYYQIRYNPRSEGKPCFHTIRDGRCIEGAQAVVLFHYESGRIAMWARNPIFSTHSDSRGEVKA